MFLHTQSPPVVHRDLKPENILLDKKHRTAKVADLGQSTYIDRSVLTDGVGTPLFCAPEALARLPYDHSVDVWGLGCVLACLSRNSPLPYDEDICGEPGMLAQVTNGELAPSIPPGASAFASLVRDCCQYQACDRPTATGVRDRYALPKRTRSVPAKCDRALTSPRAAQASNTARLAAFTGDWCGDPSECLCISCITIGRSPTLPCEGVHLYLCLSDSCAHSREPAAIFDTAWQPCFMPCSVSASIINTRACRLCGSQTSVQTKTL